MTKETGGPAFPNKQQSFMVPADMPKKYVDLLVPIELDNQGMTLRDWLAGMALQGYLSNPAFEPVGAEQNSKDAYDLADTMLKERDSK